MSNVIEETAVRKVVRVRVPPGRAFSVFVENMGSWWPASHHIAPRPFQAVVVEPRSGGRWYERDADGQACDWGKVLAWDPPHRVVLSWHLGPDWQFNADPTKASELEIRFTAEGPVTLVELEHRELQRHGEGYQQLRASLEGPQAWEMILAKFAESVEAL